MNKKTVKEIDLKGKRVLMRVDFNVPLDDKLNVDDDTRIVSALPTIKYCLQNSAKVILMSHLGRPDGRIVEKLRLNPVAKRLEKVLGQKVTKLDDCIGPQVKMAVDKMKEKDVILLENLRFHPEEEKNDKEFSKKLASLGEIYVNDAFGTAHRAHASTAGVTEFLPAVAGFLIGKEIDYLSRALSAPQKPYVAIVGGAKVSDKIEMLNNFLSRVNAILIGGGMCYTFLKAQGASIGNSRLEKDKIDIAKKIMQEAEKRKVRILLPVDNIVTKDIKDTKTQRVGRDIPEGLIGVDIGPDTVQKFIEVLKTAKTIVWNGPLGIFETDAFAKGTKLVAEFIAGLDATKIIGGGDTASAIKKFGLEDKMTHISTGGGASLEFLEGKQLPGIVALQDKE